ncbi:MAG: ATP-binding protein [Chloroflexota bacterium]
MIHNLFLAAAVHWVQLNLLAYIERQTRPNSQAMSTLRPVTPTTAHQFTNNHAVSAPTASPPFSTKSASSSQSLLTANLGVAQVPLGYAHTPSASPPQTNTRNESNFDDTDTLPSHLDDFDPELDPDVLNSPFFEHLDFVQATAHDSDLSEDSEQILDDLHENSVTDDLNNLSVMEGERVDWAQAIEEAARDMMMIASEDPPPAFSMLVQQMGLTEFEQAVLLLCATLEVSPEIGKLFQQAQGTPVPTFSLAMALFGDLDWEAISPDGALRYWRLIDINQPPDTPLTTSGLRIDERVMSYLKGLTFLDDRLRPFLLPFRSGNTEELSDVLGDIELPDSQQKKVDEALAHLNRIIGQSSTYQDWPTIQLLGPDSESKQFIAQHISDELGVKLYRLMPQLLPSTATTLTDFARLWLRECMLQPVALFVEVQDIDPEAMQQIQGQDPRQRLQRFMAQSGGLIFMDTRDIWYDLDQNNFAIDIGKPTAIEQVEAWRDAYWTAMPEMMPNHWTSGLLDALEERSFATRLATQFSLNLTKIYQISNEVVFETFSNVHEAMPDALLESIWDSAEDDSWLEEAAFSDEDLAGMGVARNASDNEREDESNEAGQTSQKLLPDFGSKLDGTRPTNLMVDDDVEDDFDDEESDLAGVDEERLIEELFTRVDVDQLLDGLWNACLAATRPKMDMLAQRIIPKATWDDIVLPDDQRTVLQYIGDQVNNRGLVYDDWGFRERVSRGLGMTVLFAGESGTGKTLASEILANYLNLNLYRIDLSSVVSKYIGETEKNLRKLFDAAEDGGMILFFDEADSLFGKRSDVKDSHDRYANIEVNYLLQRMEEYQGLAILATNLKSGLDDAFTRRLRFSVTFAKPNEESRRRIWQKIFPKETPLGALDYDYLSKTFNMAGGSIYNAALNAAFLAARSNSVVTMPLVLEAIRIEMLKEDRLIDDDQFTWYEPNTESNGTAAKVGDSATKGGTANPSSIANGRSSQFGNWADRRENKRSSNFKFTNKR